MTFEAKRDFRLDLMRGVAIVLVLLWHTQPFRDLLISHLYWASALGLYWHQGQLTLVRRSRLAQPQAATRPRLANAGATSVTAA